MKVLPVVLAAAGITFGCAQAASALDADYWRGGWRTELGSEPHIYLFSIDDNDQVHGIYCQNCSDLTTMGVIDGTWSEEGGFDITVTYLDPDGGMGASDEQYAMIEGNALIVSDVDGVGELTLIKDPRGTGFASVYLLPPGTQPSLDPAEYQPPEPPPEPAEPAEPDADEDLIFNGFHFADFWAPGEFKQITPEDLHGTWIAQYDQQGMPKQYFTFLNVDGQVRGIVCGRCDNPWTMALLDNVEIEGDLLHFDIHHVDHGEMPPPFFRPIYARLVQNEMLTAIGTAMPEPQGIPDEAPEFDVVYSMYGPIAPQATAGNSTEGVDIWGPGTGASVEPPEGVEPIVPDFPSE